MNEFFPAEYVKQCSRKDPKLKSCLIDSLHHLKPYLKDGIPEIELPSVEPFRVSIHNEINKNEKGRKIFL